MEKFAGQSALVTGGGRGIGRAVALGLAAGGARVCVTARSVEQLDGVVDEIRQAGGEAIAIRADARQPSTLDAVVDQTVAAFGGLSLVVNNVGGAHRIRPFEKLDLANFTLGTDLNYTSVHRTLSAAAPHLLAAGSRAAVVNIVSIAAERGLVGMSYYSGAKAAVVGFTRALAREWGPRGVRVNCVGPGWINTELTQPIRDNAGNGHVENPIDQVPLGRWGEPDEVADAVLFLLSDRARYVTGTTLWVDGGLLA